MTDDRIQLQVTTRDASTTIVVGNPPRPAKQISSKPEPPAEDTKAELEAPAEEPKEDEKPC